MNKQPHIIIEQGVQYNLGIIKNNTIVYDFNKILLYLDYKGKLLFGKKFKIYREDQDILLKLCTYFIQDKEGCQKMGMDTNKGILLSGPVGCGKTSLMKLLPYFVTHKKKYKILPARNITFQFNSQGFNAIEQYGNNGFYCFDDLGVEPEGRHFGKDCNVMGEILLSRYDYYSKNMSFRAQSRNLTHATTNLNAQELEDRYGNRVRSRMRQLFNLVAFDKESIDKRK